MPVVKRNPCRVPAGLAARAAAGKLSKEELLALDYTDLLLLAAHPAAGPHIAAALGVHGVPLREPYRLYPHQVKALKWMREREADPHPYGLRGGILCLEMGCGKSLTSLAHALSSPPGAYPTLIVASKTVLHEWKAQAVDKFFGGRVRALFLHADFLGADLAAVDRAAVQAHQLVFTSYDACLSAARRGKYYEDCLEYGDEHSLQKGKVVAVHLRGRRESDDPSLTGLAVLYGTPWHRVVCDESQRFANPDTATYRAAMALYGDYKWCLSGTPIRNYSTDIWAQLRFLGYNGTERKKDWKRRGEALMRLHDLNRGILAMDYATAGIAMPPKETRDVAVTLSEKEREVYAYILKQTQKAFDDLMKGLCSYACVLEMFLRLRQCAIAPYLLSPESKRNCKPEEREALERLKQGCPHGAWCCDPGTEAGVHSAKMRELVRALGALRADPARPKALVFSMFTSCLDLAAAALAAEHPDLRYEHLDGDVVGEERALVLAAFRRNPEIRVLFLTYKVGSEGLNLTEATRCFFIEPWWNAATHSQALHRAWRLGQKETVVSDFLVSAGTIEEKILELCQNKTLMAENYLKGAQHKLSKKAGLDRYTLGRILGML